ncbi:hypothetical protein HHK36_006892 [Tetracentron sinense]|uniref:F-box domain-containing protein n=1 Tax=Tetracentron sinense TaxID=13715 RepID=A0A834ZIT9_TETSI|nr:hypothetical protein HHK36_006892 [Tetracentron sinense]
METPLRRSSDIISNLPDQVVETIFAHLSIRDVVRTSLLSNKWRYKWTIIPNLVFHEDIICSSTNDKNLRIYKLVNFVDRVLLHHKGSIHKFELSTSLQQGYVIDSWILFLSRNGVKEIVLRFSTGKSYEVHSSFYSCEAICCLNMCRCILKPPPMFKGFSDLRSLNLERVTLADDILESMLSICTVLEILRLIQLNGCSCIKICCQNLQHFYFDGKYAEICFINAPHLSFVFISLRTKVADKHVGQGEISNFVRVLGSLTCLEKLVVRGYFMEFFAMGNLSKRLPFTYDHLRSISLLINFKDMNQTLVMLCLLQSSPNLRELDMVANVFAATEYVEDNFWKAQSHWNYFMNQLHVVKIRMLGARPELKFIEWLLANSPLLEILSVNHISEKKDEESRVLKELVRFQRASTKAQIQYTRELRKATERVQALIKAKVDKSLINRESSNKVKGKAYLQILFRHNHGWRFSMCYFWSVCMLEGP